MPRNQSMLVGMACTSPVNCLMAAEMSASTLAHGAPWWLQSPDASALARLCSRPQRNRCCALKVSTACATAAPAPPAPGKVTLRKLALGIGHGAFGRAVWRAWLCLKASVLRPAVRPFFKQLSADGTQRAGLDR